MVAFAAASVRRRKIRSGSSGAAERASIARNEAISAAAAVNRATVTLLPQPCWLAREIA